MRTMQLNIGNRGYEISSDGGISRLAFEFITPTGGKAIKKQIALKPSKTKHGYMRVCLASRHRFVHQIVYAAFNGPIPRGMDIDHINGIRDDNRLTNLRIATRKENALNRHSANVNSKSGIRGLHFHKRSGYWVFSANRKQIASSKYFVDVSQIALEYWGE